MTREPLSVVCAPKRVKDDDDNDDMYEISIYFGFSAGGLKAISDIFKLCTPLHSKPDLDAFKEFLGDVYVDYALVNYPYPADFLANLPAWPVKVISFLVFLFPFICCIHESSLLFVILE